MKKFLEKAYWYYFIRVKLFKALERSNVRTSTFPSQPDASTEVNRLRQKLQVFRNKEEENKWRTEQAKKEKEEHFNALYGGLPVDCLGFKVSIAPTRSIIEQNGIWGKYPASRYLSTDVVEKSRRHVKKDKGTYLDDNTAFYSVESNDNK